MATAGDDILPDLSPAEQGESRADLVAGSAGYQHFLHRLSAFISPAEALQAQGRFRRASRVLWALILSFILLYVALNQWLGPRGLASVAWANDALRAVLFLAAAVLARRLHISVAGQWLLPLSALCFLPLPVFPEPDWWKAPLILGALAAELYAVGWCLDAAGEYPQPPWTPLYRWLPRAGILLFILLCITAWRWISDGATFPACSLAAALAALLYLELTGRKPAPPPNDIDFLGAAAWKRWRFLMIGRTLAVVLGILPFLLFANLLDYQEELERCLNRDQAPEILRMDSNWQQWAAFYWRQEGRFLHETDFAPPRDQDPEILAFYLFDPATPTDPNAPELPPEFRGPAHAISLPADLNPAALHADMNALNGQTMTRAQFLQRIAPFEPLRINSRARLLRRTTDPIDVLRRDNVLALSFRPTGAQGTVFAQTPEFMLYNPEQIAHLITRYDLPKWIFFCVGILGFIFLWRRGGDSTLARWVGIWLVGVSLIPTMSASDDTLPHPTHWLWQQSVMYHWNTLASTAQPLFSLFFVATAAAALLWMFQISPAACWVHFCWPTKIHPQFPPVVRHLMIVGKLAAAFTLNCLLFCITVVPLTYLTPQNDLLQFNVFFIAATLAFLCAGILVRHFTRRSSEIPRLGLWPVLAILALHLSIICYSPSLIFFSDATPPILYARLGAAFACLFIALMGFLILKRDFLRVRAISGFTMLLLLLIVPFVVHVLEAKIPELLVGGPFFRDRGAEMVTLMLVVLLFPRCHHWLHEALLLISVPKLRHIEHRVARALEAIVDAEDDPSRARMISELLAQLHVPHYLFLSRRPKGLFVAEINALGRDVPPTLEFSEPLRKFLGHRRHFIDLQCMAFEWPFFFHQFELFRTAQALGCRYLLPIAVGESIRALLFLPDGSGGAVVSNPEVSANITNLGIAASLSRPRP